MPKKRFYPSESNAKNIQKNDIKWQKMAENTQNLGKKPINLESPIHFNDSIVKKHNEWAQKFSDSWINPRADVGTGYSLTQFNSYVENRLSYAECAFLANDTIISNAITKYANEILRKGGQIAIDNPSEEFQNELIKSLELRLQELDFWHILHKAIKTSLVYGGAVLFLDYNSENLSDEMLYNERILSKNTLKGIRVIEPYLVGANQVNSTNPLNNDYMIPSEWYISGGGTVHKSRVITLSIFECPDMIKPLYNYLGISLCQFMRDYVASADISRQGLADIFMRFKTMIIETPALIANEATAIARAKLVATQRNNQKIILLTPEEKYIETITTTAGLDKLIAQMQENIAVSARMPAVKLLGLTPSGFNATGDFDLKSYYDEIMSLQNSIIKPIIERVLYILCLEKGYNVRPTYEFERLDSESALNEAQKNATEANTINSLIQSGIITQEQGFEYLRQKEILPKSAKFESENADLSDLDNLSDLDFSQDEPKIPDLK